MKILIATLALITSLGVAHAGSVHECPLSIRKAMQAEVQGNFVLVVLSELSDSYYKLDNTEYKWWNEAKHWVSKQYGPWSMKYITPEVQAVTFHMAAGSFYEMVGREEPYIKEELDNIEIDETPTDMDRHLQTQADRIEFEMNEIQESWREMDEASPDYKPEHRQHVSLSSAAIEALAKIRSSGKLADAYRSLGWKRPDERQETPK
jgi:hypothetical protein